MNYAYGFSEKVVGDEKLSSKELAVLACIMNARGVKKAAILLGLSPRTVEAHLRNVSQKLSLISREDLLDFLEKQTWGAKLKTQAYADILAQYYFQKGLKNLSQIAIKKLSVDVYKKDAVVKQLMHDLQVCGFTPDIRIIEHKRRYLYGIKREGKIITQAECLNDCSKYYTFFLEIIRALWPTQEADIFLQNFSPYYSDIQKNQAIPPDDCVPATSYFKSSPSVIIRNILIMCSLVLCVIYGIIGKTSPPSIIHFQPSLPHKQAFLPRPSLLTAIQICLDTMETLYDIPTCILVGPGGSGKTVLTQLYGRQSKDEVIYELNAETPTHLIRSFQDLAFHLACTTEEKQDLENLCKRPPLE